MSNVKERVLLIAESKKISKEKFFSDLGLSYANFKGIQKKSGLNSDAMVIILSKYTDVDPAWLLLGEGQMYRRPHCLCATTRGESSYRADIAQDFETFPYETEASGQSAIEQVDAARQPLETVLRNNAIDIADLKQEMFDLKNEIKELKTKGEEKRS